MDPNLKRKVAIGVTAVAVAAGGGIAYAATQSSPQQERQAFLDDAAKRLNVTPGDLESALKAAAKARVDAAVAAGRLTKAQGDEIKKHIDEGGGVPFMGPGRRGGPGFGHGPMGGRFGGPGPIRAGLDAAAKYLGMTQAELRTQLRSGKSLADVAKAKGKDVAGLKSALRDTAKSRLDQAVNDKRITQAQADDMLKALDEHLDDIVNATPPRGGPGPRFRERGHHRGGPWF